ncbi:MAG TPA: hypothetical protein VGO96_11015, partial [Pyrinomonadaceae bacterium]|nr:hypothetical protein [Pyrinomonadaceae bacterium]
MIVKREEVELRRIIETPHALLMISPASGIRRPSYNGAPAMPTPVYFQTAKVIILRVPLRLSLILNDFLPLRVSYPSASKRMQERFPHRSKRLTTVTSDKLKL